MEIVSIYPPHIYSIQYDGKDENEYDRLLDEWNDINIVLAFMEENKMYLINDVWKNKTIEDATRQVLEEAETLEDLFEQLAKNTRVGEKPDFDSHFHYLDGKYKYVMEYQPMKSYGTKNPSMLRLYAIKMAENTYLITGGGIKLADKIQNSPQLKDHILQEIDAVRSWLKENGIMDSSDMEA
ncbi:MAG: hypothetical protein MJZ64_06015 [Paludibacteraceae bacterium]|nr:hypothetical protein [Paludibacteraceae bacterium]